MANRTVKIMDKETKDVIKPLIENLAHLAEKQAIILEFLAVLPNVPEDQKRKLELSAQENWKNLETWRQSLQAWK